MSDIDLLFVILITMNIGLLVLGIQVKELYRRMDKLEEDRR